MVAPVGLIDLLQPSCSGTWHPGAPLLCLRQLVHVHGDAFLLSPLGFGLRWPGHLLCVRACKAVTIGDVGLDVKDRCAVEQVQAVNGNWAQEAGLLVAEVHNSSRGVQVHHVTGLAVWLRPPPAILTLSSTYLLSPRGCEQHARLV